MSTLMRGVAHQILSRHPAAVIGIVALGGLLLFGWSISPAHQAAAISRIDGVSIDTDITGNSPSALGELDACTSIALGESVTVDVVIGPTGIPADRPAIGFQFALQYDSSVLHVTNSDPNFLLSSVAGSSLLDVSDLVPDSDGRFAAAVLDLGASETAETGPGVLARLTVTAIGQGTSDLEIDLSEAFVLDQLNNYIPIDSATAAVIGVGQPPCADSDGDTIPDLTDNCPFVANTGQQDFDGDDIGDACDPDSDNDGVSTDVDLCPNSVSGWPVDTSGCNRFQVDRDSDGICDPGAPSRGPLNCTGSDNCPSFDNPSQEDLDGDDVGDVCDPDADGDGISKSVENYYEASDLDPLSTPEALKHDPLTCSDSVDNDRDTFTDSDDSYCPPPNDNFADTFDILSFPYTDNHSSKTASLEPGEPGSCGDQPMRATVWYKFTAEVDTRLIVIAGSHDGFNMAVYTGTSLPDLQLVHCDEFNPYFIGIVPAGLTYYFQVGTGHAPGDMVNFRAWKDSDFDGQVDQFDNCPAMANPDQLDSDSDKIGDVCDPTPTHDLALVHFSLSSGNLNVKKGDSFTINISVEVANLKPWQDTGDVEIWLGSSPGYCALESLRGGSGLLIPPNGTTSAAIKAKFACRNAVPGRYPITVAGFVQHANFEMNTANNFGDDWTTRNIR